MSGDKFQEEAVLAAVKPIKTAAVAPFVGEESGTSQPNSSFRLSVARTEATEVAEIKQTEMSGLESLFRQHHERVFRTAWRVTGSAADAEDVLQTVFLRLARAKDQFEEGEAQRFDWSENPEAYLSRAAINASLDLIRKRKRSKAVAIGDVEHTTAMTSSASLAMNTAARNPEEHQEDLELRKLIRAAVSRLGEKAGEMFVLRYFEGYDNGEIARLMSTSALVVGVTLHRARARLRKEITAYLQKQPT